ncbi:hypothetical protein [Roseobacter phage RDJL6]|nr:hypothetical protein [Roseobacter phage RDJL6]
MTTHVYINGIRHYPAEPLDAETIGDLIEEGWEDQLLLLEGDLYDTEDLSQCEGCELYFTFRGDLDEELLCDDCAEESRQAAEDQRDLESWARWACR